MTVLNANNLKAADLLNIVIGQAAHGKNAARDFTIHYPNAKRPSLTVDFDMVKSKKKKSVVIMPTLAFRFKRRSVEASLYVEEGSNEADESTTANTEWLTGPKLRRAIGKLAKKHGLPDRSVRNMVEFLNSLKG